MKILRYLLAALCLTIMGVAAVAASGAPPAIQVEHGWVRWLPGKLPAAGYATISNHGNQAVALIKTSSPDYASVMLHRTVTSNGVDQMKSVGRLEIPPHGKVDISPGNYHLMLMHATHPINPGDTISIAFQFSDGAVVHAQFKVDPPTKTS